MYFTSTSTKDFGEGAAFPYPMDEDLRRLEDRFVLLTSVCDIVERFAERAEADAVLTAVRQQRVFGEVVFRALADLSSDFLVLGRPS
ncbi:hypothetical protein [Streptomyces sp. NPDC048442]|uniref:hypothetical protein n=1 Tax=Streptomyces sp. NPDC048442 TaxID=3154823 RepID=UPI00342BAB84